MSAGQPSHDLRIALVSREVYPFFGGGIGNYVTATAQALSEVAEVTIVTSEAYERQYRKLARAGDSRLPPGVRFEFVFEPEWDDHGGYYGFFHRWSALVFEALVRLYPDGGPDLVEFADYHGEGAVSVQASHTLDPRLRNTCVCVHTHTSSEMCHLLDGRLDSDFAFRAMFELERYSLHHADRLVWPGGDVLGTYQRYYGVDAIAPPVPIPHAASIHPDEPPPVPPPAEGLTEQGPLRLLYMGRIERRKGVWNLMRALRLLEREDWSLTLLGADTDTGPLETSVRGLVELTAGGDPRVRFLDRVPRERLLEIVDEHHVCVVPSLWECWPYVVLEAFQRGRPVLATPTGGLVEMVKPGRSGWLTPGTGWTEVAQGIDRLLSGREEVAALGTEGPRGVFLELTDPEAVRERFVELARTGGRRQRVTARPASSHPPLVSVIVTYYELDAYVEEAVASICAQTHPSLEVLIVNDGSLRERDAAVLDGIGSRYPVSVVTQPNSGLPAARNLGVLLTRGRYVLPFDADDVAEPQLVARCVEVLEADPEAVYAATWSRFIDEDGTPLDDGYQPIGNFSPLIREVNVAGGACSLIRREVFERGFSYHQEFPSYEDWYLFRQLHEAGLHGHVIPERLYRYRVRRSSMLRRVGDPRMQRFREEMETHLREREVQWVAEAL